MEYVFGEGIGIHPFIHVIYSPNTHPKHCGPAESCEQRRGGPYRLPSGGVVRQSCKWTMTVEYDVPCEGLWGHRGRLDGGQGSSAGSLEKGPRAGPERCVSVGQA